LIPYVLCEHSSPHFFAQFVFVGKPKTAAWWSSREATKSKHRLDLQARVEEGKETGTLASFARARRVSILSSEIGCKKPYCSRCTKHPSTSAFFTLMCRVVCIFFDVQSCILSEEVSIFWVWWPRMALVFFTYIIVLTPMLRPLLVNHKTWGGIVE
jgi:hypothetical protein